MKKLKQMKKLSFVSGAAGLALSAVSAQAQFQYSTSDLLAVFNTAGSSVDVEVDLGSINNYLNQPAGTTVQLNLYNADSQLLALLGGSLSGVNFAVVGTTGSTAGTTSFLTLARSNPGVQTSTPYGYKSSAYTSLAGAINSVGTGAASWGAAVGPDAITNSANVAIIPNSSTYTLYNDSWSHAEGTGGLVSDTYNNSGSSTTQGPINVLTSSGGVSDLYEYTDPASRTAAAITPTFLGSFTVNSDGTLDYTSGAVPEPSAYALGGVGLLVLAWRQRQLKRQAA
jgi:hypothetical protein